MPNSRPVEAFATFDEAVLSRGPREQHVSSSDDQVDGDAKHSASSS